MKIQRELVVNDRNFKESLFEIQRATGESKIDICRKLNENGFKIAYITFKQWDKNATNNINRQEEFINKMNEIYGETFERRGFKLTYQLW